MVFHIELTTDDRKIEDEMIKWRMENPFAKIILYSHHFHGIQSGVCCHLESCRLEEANEVRDIIMASQILNNFTDSETKEEISSKIEVGKPWNDDIAPEWYNGTQEEWVAKN